MAHPDRKGRQPTPPSTPRGPRRLEVTRFSGGQLQQVYADTTTYLTSIPDQSRDQAVDALTLKPKEAKRMQDALDVLNQLAVVDRSGADVRSIVVFEMHDTPPVDKFHHAEGSLHRQYDIVWENPPEAKPAPLPERQRPAKREVNRPPKPSFREIRQQEKAERRAQREYEAQQEIQRQERLAVDKIIIDTTAENAQDTIHSGAVFIGTSEEGEGAILFSKFGGSNHQIVDRDDGSFTDWGEYRSYLKPDYLKFYEGIAREIETGIPCDYEPAPLTPEVCAETYEKALNLRMLNIQQTDDGHQFGYPDSPSSLFFDTFQQLLPRFSPVNLDEGVIPVDSRWRPRNRPIHPDFAEFLRQKKAELDAQSKE